MGGKNDSRNGGQKQAFFWGETPRRSLVCVADQISVFLRAISWINCGLFLPSQYIAKKIIALGIFAFSRAITRIWLDMDGCFRPISSRVLLICSIVFLVRFVSTFL